MLSLHAFLATPAQSVAATVWEGSSASPPPRSKVSARAEARSKANVAQSVELLPARVGHTGAARESSVVRNQGSSYSAHMELKLQPETVTPNPSFKRTRSGGAGLAFISFWAKPALPPRAAQFKR